MSTPSRIARPSRQRLLGCLAVLLLAIVCGLGWYQYRRSAERQVQDALRDARSDMEAGRTATAARRLNELARAWPGRGDVLLALGRCEQLRGRADAALAAWGKVPSTSPEAAEALVRSAQLEVLIGRFDPAEKRLRAALDTLPAGPDEAQARAALVRLLQSGGRHREARRCAIEGVGKALDPIGALRFLDRLDAEPYATEGMESYLAQAEQQAPDDARVRLARANFLLAMGQLESADALLESLLERHPNDPAIWSIRLAWARSANRPDVALLAAQHLPADPALAAELDAWFAAKSGNAPGERKALERWLSIEPASAPALARLAEIDAAENRLDEAARLRARKLEADSARKRYRSFIAGADPKTDADALAGLADELGLSFEASCWRWVASGKRGAAPEPPKPPEGTLAALLRSNPTSPASEGIESEPRPARLAFVDDAEAVGLRFVHDNGDPGRRMIPPVTFSGGVALFDMDQDGWLDVYCVQGGAFPPAPDTPGGDRLFRNRGNGTFEDVTERSGIARAVRGYGHGVSVGDYDNDGRPDLFLTRWHAYTLLHNEGNGAFRDVSESAGLGGERDWPTSSAFADFDNDGDLDLYVCHYLEWDVNSTLACVDPRDPSVYHCAPLDFDALPDHVFRNDAGRFMDVSKEAGLIDANGRGLGVLAADLDADGLVDLFVANDTSANFLFRNRGGFRFEEVAQTAGVAANGAGGFQAGMGVACGDLDGDGRLDLAVTNFYNESTSFFRNQGSGLFSDQTAASGLTAATRFLLGFGLAFFDADCDGRPDLISANGHVFDGRPVYPWKMPVQLLWNAGGGRLRDVSRRAGDVFAIPRMGRGLAIGDLDNDGRTDALVIDQNGALAYLHNQSETGRSLTLDLEGTRSNRDAVGAIVTVTVGGRSQVIPRLGGGSFQSASDPRLQIGLGESPSADSVEVRWPSGQVDRHEALPAGRYRLREGDPKPMTGRGS